MRSRAGFHLIRSTVLPRGIAAWLMLLALAGCTSAPKAPEPDYAELHAKVKTVALTPARSSTALVRPRQIEQAFHPRASRRLAAAGLEVVELGVWDELWRRYAGDVGGVFDASTGEADERKFETVREAVQRELVEAHGVDAFLHLQVRVVETYGVSRTPEVCGEAAAVYWPGGWTNRGSDPAPLVRTSCLQGFLVDPSGKEYLSRQAPLEGLETFDEQTRAVRPREQVLRDDAVLDHALDVVLQPFPARAGDSGAGPAPSPGPAEAEPDAG